MKTRQPMMVEDGEHRVIAFRPRSSAPSETRLSMQGRRVSGGQVQALRRQPLPYEGPEPYDLSRYERVRNEEPDDFQHRILANIAAIAFTAALMAIGMWLAVSINDLRHLQDCEAMGQHDCTHILNQDKNPHPYPVLTPAFTG